MSDIAPAPQEELTLVVDGVTYKSSEPDLPEDIAELIGRIVTQAQEIITRRLRPAVET